MNSQSIVLFCNRLTRSSLSLLRFVTAASLALLVSLRPDSGVCVADLIIDQQQLQKDAAYGFGAGFYRGEQEVVAGLSGTLGGFDFVGNGIGSLSAIDIDVSVKLGTAQSGSVVFQQRISYGSENVGSFFFVDTSESNIVLQSGDRFVLGLYPRGVFEAGGNYGNTYPAGSFFFDGNENSSYDLAFRTYMTAVPDDIPAVPEVDPAGMGSALAVVSAAIGLLERRRLKVRRTISSMSHLPTQLPASPSIAPRT